MSLKGLGSWGLVLAVCLLALVGMTAEGVAGSKEAVVISLAEADVKLVGEEIGDWAGYSVSPAGDVNGDGFADVIIGAPLAGDKTPTPTPKGEGIAYLVLGRPLDQWPAGPIVLTDADASFKGCRRTSMSARQNYAAGDVNGDGYDDFLISGWKCDEDELFQGKAYLFLGKPEIDWGSEFPVEAADASFLGEAERNHAGYYVSAAGDVNDDGYDDFMVTASHNSEVGYKAGQVYLILGRADADWGSNYPLSQADASFLGEVEDDRAGRSAAGAGDVNGDGYDDFLIGAINSDDAGGGAGQSYLILGRGAADWGMDYPLSQSDASFLGEAAGDEVGRRVAGAGDVNGDGYGDLVIGASRNDEAGYEAGKAYLILGREQVDWGMDYSLALADAAFLGENIFDQAGRRVSSAGDVNDDGYDDFLIGAPHSDRGGESAGVAYLLLGRASADWGTEFSLASADLVYVGEAGFDSAGYDVAPAGDVDGDGVDDFIIGAYGGREQLEIPGQAYVVLTAGASGPQPVQFSADSPDGQVREWHLFWSEYSDPDGWEDLATAQMVLGRRETDRKGLNVLYEANENAFYLWDPVGSAWLGPCSPGERLRLHNGFVQLDCTRSAVTHNGEELLQVTVRGRWLPQVPGPLEMTAFLRAVDQAGGDSGFLGMGTWTLLPKTE